MKQNLKNRNEISIKASQNAGFFIPEILSPAGSLQGLIGAVNAGADAVYLGGEMYSARAFAQNFTTEEIVKGIEYAHAFGAKVYLTVNTLLKNKEMQNLCDYISPLYLAGLDGVIVQDLGVLEVLKEAFPDLNRHASTQMAVTTKYGAEYLREKYGVERVVLARELKLDEIQKIVDTGIETECFIHGSMCYCVSGQCLFSSLVGGRSGNRGRCAQSCRLPYKYMDEKNEQYLLSLKDMCTLEFLPQILDAGITSLKIEGRMKSPAYTAGVTAIYRKYVDMYLSNPDEYKIDKRDLDTLRSLYIRTDIQTGYYEKYRAKSMLTVNNPAYSKTDDELIDSLIEEYCNNYKKIDINCIVNAYVDSPLSITLYGEGFEDVTVTGDVVLEAKNRPLSEADYLKAIDKLGDSPYKINEFVCNMDSNTFMSVGAIKDLRRRAISELSMKLSGYNRNSDNINAYYAEYVNQICDVQNMNKTIQDTICFCNTVDQLKAVINFGKISEIAVSFSLLRNKEAMSLFKANNKVFVCLPELVRMEMVEDIIALIDSLGEVKVSGFYVNQIDSLRIMLDYKKNTGIDYEIRSDLLLYTYNNMSISNIRDDIDSYTVSVELNKDELKYLDKENAEMLVYGYIPLMNTANCVNLTKGKCKKFTNKYDEITYLVDRKNQKECIVTHCDEKVCYNTIYNNVPLSLHKSLGMLEGYGFKRRQLRFVFEDYVDTQKVLDLFINDGHINDDYKYTNGHFMRGVD